MFLITATNNYYLNKSKSSLVNLFTCQRGSALQTEKNYTITREKEKAVRELEEARALCRQLQHFEIEVKILREEKVELLAKIDVLSKGEAEYKQVRGGRIEGTRVRNARPPIAREIAREIARGIASCVRDPRDDAAGFTPLQA
eukprot:9264074-Pyramimonas_sp.AAC.1